jgi:hypothetical protein
MNSPCAAFTGLARRLACVTYQRGASRLPLASSLQYRCGCLEPHLTRVHAVASWHGVSLCHTLPSFHMPPRMTGNASHSFSSKPIPRTSTCAVIIHMHATQLRRRAPSLPSALHRIRLRAYRRQTSTTSGQRTASCAYAYGHRMVSVWCRAHGAWCRVIRQRLSSRTTYCRQ